MSDSCFFKLLSPLRGEEHEHEALYLLDIRARDGRPNYRAARTSRTDPAQPRAMAESPVTR